MKEEKRLMCQTTTKKETAEEREVMGTTNTRVAVGAREIKMI